MSLYQRKSPRSPIYIQSYKPYDYCPDYTWEPEEPDVLGYCEGCGREIYDGDNILVDENDMWIHDNRDCILRAFNLRRRVADKYEEK